MDYNEKFFSYQKSYNSAKGFIENVLKKKQINKNDFKKSKKPKISAIIPCYNCKNYVDNAILSIQNQNFSDFEIFRPMNLYYFSKNLKKMRQD